VANEIQKAKAEKNAIDLAAKLTPFEAAAFSGDLAKLQPEERGVYLLQFCQSLGVNPLSGAIQFLMLDGRLVLYATKGCAQQLARRDHVTVKTSEPKVVLGILMCEATAELTTPDGQIRTANNVGCVPWDDKAAAKEKCNAVMKCVTKAERRVILSICGLGLMDEAELDTVERSRWKRVTGPNFDVIEGDGPEMPSAQENRAAPPQRLKDAAPKRPLKPFEAELAKERREWMAEMKKSDVDWINTFAPGKTWSQINYEAVYNDMIAIKNAPAFSEAVAAHE